MRSILYRDGVAVAHDLAELTDPVEGSGEALWIDVDRDDHDAIARLGEIFHLHPLALAAVAEEPGRTRLDRFEHHFSLTVYGTRLDAKERLVPLPMMAMLTTGTMISIRPHDSIDIDAVREQWEANPELLRSGAIAMFWALLDNVIDSHFDTVQDLDERVGDLEAEVFADEPEIRRLQHECFVLHREVTHLRRLALPLRDITNAVLRHDPRGAVGPVTPYLQDVYDHALRVADWSDNIHDTLATMFDSILNAQSNQLNVVMKKITGWAALIAVPTMITGFFGMNLAYPFYGTVAGFWLSMGLMAGSVLALYLAFKRNNWL